MGILYFLVKKETKEYFDLNKGFWRFAEPNSIVTFTSIDEVRNKVKDCVESLSVPEWYADKVADTIFEWMGSSSALFVTDSVMDTWEDVDEYKETGTRFIHTMSDWLKP